MKRGGAREGWKREMHGRRWRGKTEREGESRGMRVERDVEGGGIEKGVWRKKEERREVGR